MTTLPEATADNALPPAKDTKVYNSLILSSGLPGVIVKIMICGWRKPSKLPGIMFIPPCLVITHHKIPVRYCAVISSCKENWVIPSDIYMEP